MELEREETTVSKNFIEQIMVEQHKCLEMTLSQLKSYVESSESNVLLVVEFPKGDQNNGE